MTQRFSWEDLIPINETETAVRFLVTTWNRIAQTQPNLVQYSNREPNLTERLHFYLDKFAANSGLTGFWINEAQNAIYNEEGNLCDRIRKDITYCSNESSIRLELIFEFKKVSRTSLATYRGEQGMHRFVDGNYAINKSLAVMVGILKARDSSIIDTLCTSLSSVKVRNGLRMVCDDAGQYVRCPSEIIPTFVEFSTKHLRPPEKAPPHGSITIAHLFLICEH